MASSIDLSSGMESGTIELELLSIRSGLSFTSASSFASISCPTFVEIMLSMESNRIADYPICG